MHKNTNLRPALVAIILCLTVAACTRTDGSAPPPGTQPGSRPTPISSTTAPVASGPGASVCSLEVLTAVARSKYSSATLSDVVCSAPFGVATIKGGSQPGEAVAFFRVDGANWTLVADQAIASDGKDGVPAGFSAVILSAWRSTHDSARAPATTASRPRSTAAAGVTTPSGGTTCVTTNDGVNCYTATTPAPATSSTTPQTTPDGKPVPTTPPVTSQFCKFNYIDPRCQLDPRFPGQ